MIVPVGLIFILVAVGVTLGLRWKRRFLGLPLAAICVAVGGMLIYQIVTSELHNQRQAIAWPHVEKARVLLRDGNTAEARAELDEAIRIQPTEFVAVGMRASLRLDDKDYAGAEQDFTIVLAHAPPQDGGRLIAYLGRGKARAMLNQSTAARADFNRAAELSPQMREEIQKERDKLLGKE